MSLSLMQYALLSILAVFMAVFVKKYQPELSLLICMGMCLILLFFVFTALEGIRTYMNSLSGMVRWEYLEVLIKLIGIAYICEFASGLCRDAGYSSVAAQVEAAGRVAMLVITLPILQGILETVNQFLN